MKFPWTFSLALCLLALFASDASAERRLALVIGNSEYVVAPLANPRNDAALMAATLTDVGFEVTLIDDASLRVFQRAVIEFSRAVSAAGEDTVALFYFAGHGIQADGKNYLVPVDADIRDALDLRFQTMEVGAIMTALESAGNRLNLVVFDACRNNPFPATSRSSGAGLAKVEAPFGTLVAYATAPGGVAVDGAGAGNSPYTQALAKAIRAPGMAVEQVFKRVRIDVMERTGNQQVPWESSSLTGDFFFVPKAGIERAESEGVGAASPDAEILFWQSVQNSDNPKTFQAYLDAYPNGRFAALARIRIQELGEFPGESPLALGVDLSPGRVFRDCAECPQMVVVPSGRFRMGSPNDEAGRDDDEGPRRTVRIDAPFAVGVFEVTRAQFETFVDETGWRTGSACRRPEGDSWVNTSGLTWLDPGYSQTSDHPVVCVSWRDAGAYVDWLVRKTGQPYRLLSEAEWEYVARAGTRTALPHGPDHDMSGLCDIANGAAKETNLAGNNEACADPYTESAPVGSFQENAFGLRDTHGNVWEWVADCYRGSYDRRSVDAAPFDEPRCENRVMRGGSFFYGPTHLRSAYRSSAEPGARDVDTGFRIARDLSSKS